MSGSKNKLVSVVVVSYNAADSIASTLDSIYRQTYQNIELIIADDASKDNTVAVAEVWIATHRERFVNCILLAHENNLGVTGNANSGVQIATGEYIKIFAADDRLQPDYLTLHVRYLEEHGVDCVCSHMRAFRLEDGKTVYFDFFPPAGPDFFDSDAKNQYRMLLCVNRVYSPTFLARRSLYDQHGLFDTRFPLMEDYPFYIKLTKEGTKLNYLDVCLVDYCYSETSLSNATTTRILHPGFHKMMRSFFYKERLLGLLRHGIFKYILLSFWQLFFGDCVLLFGNSRRKPLARFFDNLRTLEFFTRKKEIIKQVILMKIKKYTFQPHGDHRGQLVALEEFKDIPFDIKRVYYMYDTVPGIARGFHAHRNLEQILICVHGSCKILLDDGTEKAVVSLDKPNEGLYIANNMWREMFDFSPDAVLMVLASQLYDEADYIRNYEDFLAFVRGEGK